MRVAEMLQWNTNMSPSGDFDFDDPAAVERFRGVLADLAGRARELPADARHDIGNAVGAARNALELIAESRGKPERARFVEIALRNAERAERLLTSCGNERNDLGGPSKGNHRDAFGF